jgi:hypothetical protein
VVPGVEAAERQVVADDHAAVAVETTGEAGCLVVAAARPVRRIAADVEDVVVRLVDQTAQDGRKRRRITRREGPVAAPRREAAVDPDRVDELKDRVGAVVPLRVGGGAVRVVRPPRNPDLVAPGEVAVGQRVLEVPKGIRPRAAVTGDGDLGVDVPDVGVGNRRCPNPRRDADHHLPPHAISPCRRACYGTP